MTNDFRAKLKAFLAKFFHNIDLQDDEDIFALGFINSLFAMQLVLFIENECNIKIDNEDLDIKNFSTIAAIVDLVEHKIASNTKP